MSSAQQPQAGAPGGVGVEEVLAASTTGALTMDRAGRLLWANEAARRLLGLNDDAASTASLPELEDLWTALPLAVLNSGAPHDRSRWTGEIRRRGRDALTRTLGVEAVVRRDAQGATAQATVLLRDISETSRLHAELLHQASHDALTGLPNRTRLRRASAEAVERLRSGGGTVALLFVDLDHVKVVNDVAGHDVGDQVIVHAGQRLAASIRPRDLVARLGGDEFVVLCEGMADGHAALEVAERVRQALSERVEIAGHTVALAASIGVAVLTAAAARDDDRAAHELADAVLQQADSAMYLAKQRGRGRCELFDDALGTLIAQRRAHGGELVRALADGTVDCAWLPLHDLVRGHVTGWYAQVRWRPSDGVELGHDEIVGLASQTGSEAALAHLVLERALTAPGLSTRRHVLVPCSSAQIGDPRTVDTARRVLSHLRRDATSLTLVVDESVIGAADADVERSLRALPRLGVGLGVSGVGGSATPVRRLGELPIERLLLHADLTAEVGLSDRAEALTRSMVHLGHALDAMVGAMLGAGDAMSLARRTERLRALGCDEVIGRPTAVPSAQELTAT